MASEVQPRLIVDAQRIVLTSGGHCQACSLQQRGAECKQTNRIIVIKTPGRQIGSGARTVSRQDTQSCRDTLSLAQMLFYQNLVPLL